MADDVENLTLRVLQEMRAESNSRFDRIDARFGEMEQRLTDLVQRVDGDTLLLNPVAGVVHYHESRIADLEQRGA